MLFCSVQTRLCPVTDSVAHSTAMLLPADGIGIGTDFGTLYLPKPFLWKKRNRILVSVFRMFYPVASVFLWIWMAVVWLDMACGITHLRTCGIIEFCRRKSVGSIAFVDRTLLDLYQFSFEFVDYFVELKKNACIFLRTVLY